MKRLRQQMSERHCQEQTCRNAHQPVNQGCQPAEAQPGSQADRYDGRQHVGSDDVGKRGGHGVLMSVLLTITNPSSPYRGDGKKKPPGEAAACLNELALREIALEPRHAAFPSVLGSLLAI